MTILAAICLNEEQFIGAWLRYHYPSFDRIIICEGAARNYPRYAITSHGLSLDKTASIIKAFPDPDRKITFIQYGWAGPDVSVDPCVPAKIELRNVYADHILQDAYVYTLDVDEFLHPTFVATLNKHMDAVPQANSCFVPQLHLWQDTEHYITGGYANISHCRLYRWQSGSRYKVSHNWPSSPDGTLLSDHRIQPKLKCDEGVLIAPAIVHYGFCENKQSMREKNLYYISRGEKQSRPATTEFRDYALRGIKPSDCEVRPYRGFLPFLPSE